MPISERATRCSLTATEGPPAPDLAQTMREFLEKVERNIVKSDSLHAEVAALRADVSEIRSENASILKAAHEILEAVNVVFEKTQATEGDGEDIMME